MVNEIKPNSPERRSVKILKAADELLSDASPAQRHGYLRRLHDARETVSTKLLKIHAVRQSIQAADRELEEALAHLNDELIACQRSRAE